MLVFDWFRNIIDLKSCNLCFGFHHWIIGRGREWKELHQLIKTRCLHNPDDAWNSIDQRAQLKAKKQKNSRNWTTVWLLQVSCWTIKRLILDVRWGQRQLAFNLLRAGSQRKQPQCPASYRGGLKLWLPHHNSRQLLFIFFLKHSKFDSQVKSNFIKNLWVFLSPSHPPRWYIGASACTKAGGGGGRDSFDDNPSMCNSHP